MAKIRVLTLSKPYVTATYRQKLRILSQDSRFEIGLITPTQWAGQAFEVHPEDSYWMRQLPIYMNGHNHFHFYSGLEQAVRDFKPDIFNIEEEHYSYVTWQCFRIALKYKVKPIFYTWQNIYKKYPAPFSWIERDIFRHAAGAIAGNQEAVDILRSKKYRGLARVIPQMGADAVALQAAKAGASVFREELLQRLQLSADSFLVIFAGRLVEEKGIQDLIHALRHLSDEPIHALVLGVGPWQQNLWQLTQELALQSRVHFLGSVSGDEIYRYFAIAESIVLPSHTRSNWKEQFGRVLVEAMLSRSVPVGSDSGEIPQVIADAGLIFPEGDSIELAQCLRKLFRDKLLRHSLAERGYQRASEHFTNNVIAQRFAEVFLEVTHNSTVSA